MASEAQIEANRRNALRSTGPRTEEGRAVSSRNALRHGLTARQIVLFDETEEDFAGFQAELRAALAPWDAVEEHYAEQIILCAWRLRRVGRAEAALANAAAKRGGGRPQDEESTVDAAFEFGLPALTALSRYEAGLERALYRAHAALERRQARRGANIENCETKPIPPAGPVGQASVREAEAAEADGAPESDRCHYL